VLGQATLLGTLGTPLHRETLVYLLGDTSVPIGSYYTSGFLIGILWLSWWETVVILQGDTGYPTGYTSLSVGTHLFSNRETVVSLQRDTVSPTGRGSPPWLDVPGLPDANMEKHVRNVICFDRPWISYLYVLYRG